MYINVMEFNQNILFPTTALQNNVLSNPKRFNKQVIYKLHLLFTQVCKVGYIFGFLRLVYGCGYRVNDDNNQIFLNVILPHILMYRILIRLSIVT